MFWNMANIYVDKFVILRSPLNNFINSGISNALRYMHDMIDIKNKFPFEKEWAQWSK